MNKEYFDFVNQLEELGVTDQYMIGWQEGYQGSLKLKNRGSLMIMRLATRMVLTKRLIVLINSKKLTSG